MMTVSRMPPHPFYVPWALCVRGVRDYSSESSSVLTGNRNTGNARLSRLLFILLCATFILSFGMVRSTRFGESYDDTIYVTAAKSLATGEGYHIISAPQPVAQTLIPPLYPFVLSLIWRAYPQFPDNLVWMMLLSVITMVGFLGLTWRYLVQENYATRGQALAIVTLAGVNWRMLTLTTSILSEVLFALLSVGALHLAEKYEKSQKTWILGAVLGLVVGLVFLTRTSGLVLLAAVAVYLVLRRQWKKALLPVAVGTLFVAAWFGWCYLNRNAGGGEHAAYYAGYVRGTNATLGQLQALNQTSRLNAHLQIIATNAVGLILVWLPVQSLGLRASMPTAMLVSIILFFLALLCAGLLRETHKGLRLLHIYLAFYVVLHLMAPSHSYERYLMPIIPFMLVFPVSELAALSSTLRGGLKPGGEALKKVVAVTVGLVVVVVASPALYSNATGIYLSLASPKSNAASAAGEADTYNWIKANTNPSDILVCFADPKFYLFTGRKVVRSVTVNILDLVVYQEREPNPEDLVKVFLNIVDENRGNYLVVGATDFEYQAPAYGRSIESYIAKHPEQFVLVFQSIEGTNRIYRIQNRGGTVVGSHAPGRSSFERSRRILVLGLARRLGGREALVQTTDRMSRDSRLRRWAEGLPD